MMIDDKPDAGRRRMFRECMKNFDVGNRDYDWPNNMISTKASFFESGAIVRKGDTVVRRVDSNELALCKRLAKRACRVPHLHFDIGSASCNPIWEFYVVAKIGERVPRRITSKLIRSRFGGTLFPAATITVEALKEKGVWWSEVVDSIGETGKVLEQLLQPYRQMIRWFGQEPEFVATAFVRIGDWLELIDLPESDYPEGTELVPSVLPRLALGLTKTGSLAGVFGYTVRS